MRGSWGACLRAGVALAAVLSLGACAADYGYGTYGYGYGAGYPGYYESPFFGPPFVGVFGEGENFHHHDHDFDHPHEFDHHFANPGGHGFAANAPHLAAPPAAPRVAAPPPAPPPAAAHMGGHLPLPNYRTLGIEGGG